MDSGNMKQGIYIPCHFGEIILILQITYINLRAWQQLRDSFFLLYGTNQHPKHIW